VRLLLDLGANPRCIDRDGYSAIALANRAPGYRFPADTIVAMLRAAMVNGK
jgi:hypothetical protein